MHHVIACVFCGGDPATESLLLQTAIAGGIATPWMLRRQLRDAVSRLRKGSLRGGLRASHEADGACPLPYAEDEGEAEPEEPTKAR